MSVLSPFQLIFQMFQRRNLSEIIKKNIGILFCYPLYWISFLFPRKSNKWLVGSHVGFSGNPKYFFLYVCTNHPEKKCIWIASNKKGAKKVSELGFPAFYRWSMKGLYHSLTAKTYIFGFHLIDVNFWTSGRVNRVNLWHGVGIKNIEFKSTIGSAGKIYDEKNIISRIFFPYLFKRPHLFLSTSPLMTEHFKQCFRITDKECFEGIYPRCAIFGWKNNEIEEFIYNYEAKESRELLMRLKKCRKSYLYMPTWRETRANFIVSAGFDFARLDAYLKQKNDLFLMKLHPESNISVENMKEYVNIVLVDKQIDIYPILPFTDVLITDYSSIYYDYLLMKDKQVLLFPFDYLEYVTQGRDLAFDFDKYTPGRRAYSFEELLQFISDDNLLYFKEKEWVTKQFWDYQYSESDLYDKIVSLTKE